MVHSFGIATLGLPERELRVIRLVLSFASKNVQSRVYIFYDTPPLKEEKENVQIVLVNWDDPAALLQWQSFQIGRPGIYGVMIADNEINTAGYQVKKRLLATKLVPTLDRLLAEKFKIMPELVIGAEENTQNVTNLGNMQPAISSEQLTRVLVVDDSGTTRKQLELGLQLFGLKADLAASADEAFALLNRHIYDLIFLDVVLPGDIDGYQICKSIKRDKNIKETAVVMLTSRSSPFDKVRGALAGCNAYLVKPVEQSLFNATVEKYTQFARARSRNGTDFTV